MAKRRNRTADRARNIADRAQATRLRQFGKGTGAFVTTTGRRRNVTGLLVSAGAKRSKLAIAGRGYPVITIASGKHRTATRGETVRAVRATRAADRVSRRYFGLASHARITRAERSRIGLHTRADFVSGGRTSPYRTKSQHQRAVHELTRGRVKVARSVFNRLHPRGRNGRFIQKLGRA